MPNPKICNKIADPAARRRCMNYEGEFAQQGGGPAGRPGGPAGGRMGGLGGRMPRRRGRGGFGGGGY